MSIKIIHTIAKLNEFYKTKFLDKQEDIVLGEGCANPRIVIVGEAPGKDEVQQGHPFVGKAGKNLDFFLSELGIDRKDIYITNAIKYRLKKISHKSGRFINRPATPCDISLNMGILHKEIAILRPQFIITLGNVPLKAVTNDTKINIGNVHGKMITVTVDEIMFSLYPLYHPASIIYNPALKDVYMKDIRNLKAKIFYNLQ